MITLKRIIGFLKHPDPAHPSIQSSTITCYLRPAYKSAGFSWADFADTHEFPSSEKCSGGRGRSFILPAISPFGQESSRSSQLCELWYAQALARTWIFFPPPPLPPPPLIASLLARLHQFVPIKHRRRFVPAEEIFSKRRSEGTRLPR